MALERTVSLLERVRRTIARERLRPADGRLLVACSGGLDSTALLELLHLLAEPLDLRLVVATYDHRWRDEPEDLALVRDQCARLGLTCLVGRAEKREHSETRARNQRHAFLRRAAAEAGCSRIALAHHLDDRLETLLMNLLRGAGTTGLGAMPPRDDPIVRPLAEARRAEIAAWLSDRRVPWFADPANEDQAHHRNRVRHVLLPLFEHDFPGGGEALLRTARLCAMERAVLAEAAAERLARRMREPTGFLHGLGAVVLDLTDWHERPRGEQYLLWRAALARLAGDLSDIELADIERLEELAELPPGAGPITIATSAGRALACLHGGTAILLLADRMPGRWEPRPLAIGRNVIEGAGLAVHLGAAPSWLTTRAELRSRCEAQWRARPRLPGDVLRPAGRGGSRKVSDLMQELGIPSLVRDRVPLVCDGDRPVWLPGCAPEEEYAGGADNSLPVAIEFVEPDG